MLKKRPFGVTLLLWLVLILIVWGAVRFLATLHAWDFLLEFESSLSPLYLAVTGAGWSVVGCVLLWSMFINQPWTRQAILIAIVVWLIEYWVERIFFQAPRANLLFSVTGSVFMLGTVLASTLHKSTRDFFTRSEEYEQQIENSDSQ